MGSAALFLLLCDIMCPCFPQRKRTTVQTVNEQQQSSQSNFEASLSSSMEMSSAPDIVLPSPLRVAPSPSRFAMSPHHDKLGSFHLSMRHLVRATHNFSESMKIGEGGFGMVYKAQLPDGQLVAVKRAFKELFENLQTEFRSEIELLAKIEHMNLVKLLGYVDKGTERLLITEYVPNGTLREHLDGLHGKILDFNQRLQICIDVAHALTYLHSYAEMPIIHRDVKSSNILLTGSMRAKVADFGFAKLGDLETDKTHYSTKVKGTLGYLDPEYMKTRRLTAKSDVYSFGILLLEILTGRRPVEVNKPQQERVTLRWAFKKYREGNVMEMLDPLMKEPVDRKIVRKMFGLAIMCVAPKRSERPDMQQVGEQLWEVRSDNQRSRKT